jgi:hypothetical protein
MMNKKKNERGRRNKITGNRSIAVGQQNKKYFDMKKL